MVVNKDLVVVLKAKYTSPQLSSFIVRWGRARHHVATNWL